jgi:hypothetical protein
MKHGVISTIFFSTAIITANFCFADEAVQDSVKITRISPDPSAPLYPGQKIKVEVEVEYSLNSADSGSVSLVIQKLESGEAPLANESDVVTKGSGTVVLSKFIEIPYTKGLSVFTPLTGSTRSTTSVVATQLYKVVTN